MLPNILVVGVVYILLNVYIWVWMYRKSAYYSPKLPSIAQYRSKGLLHLQYTICAFWNVYYTLVPFLYTYFDDVTHTCSISYLMILASVATTFFSHFSRVLDMFCLGYTHSMIYGMALKRHVPERNCGAENNSIVYRIELLTRLVKKLRSPTLMFWVQMICAVLSTFILWISSEGLTWDDSSFSSSRCRNPVTNVVIGAKFAAIITVLICTVFMMVWKFGGDYKREIIYDMSLCASAVSCWLLFTSYIHRLAGSFFYASLCTGWVYCGWIYFPQRIIRGLSSKNTSKTEEERLTALSHMDQSLYTSIGQRNYTIVIENSHSIDKDQAKLTDRGDVMKEPKPSNDSVQKPQIVSSTVLPASPRLDTSSGTHRHPKIHPKIVSLRPPHSTSAPQKVTSTVQNLPLTIHPKRNNLVSPCSLDDIWNNSDLLAQWKFHCAKHLCLESSLAYEDLRTWKAHITSEGAQQSVLQLGRFYHTYVNRSSLYLINISDQLFKEWDALFYSLQQKDVKTDSNIDIELILKAETIVEETIRSLGSLMTMDILPRFLKSHQSLA